MSAWTPITLYTGAGRDEDTLLAAIHRNTAADHAFLAGTRARWYNESTGHWSADWSAYAMAKKAAAKKPVPAKEAIRRPSPSEQRALDKKQALGKADPVKDKAYPPKGLKKEVAQIAEDRKKEQAKKDKPAPKPAVPLDDVADLQDCLPDLIEEYKLLKGQRAIIDLRLDELGPEIVALLEAVGQRAVFTDEWQVSRATNTNVSISKEKLVEAGVDPDVIEECTIRKETNAFAKLTLRGEKGE